MLIAELLSTNFIDIASLFAILGLPMPIDNLFKYAQWSGKLFQFF